MKAPVETAPESLGEVGLLLASVCLSPQLSGRMLVGSDPLLSSSKASRISASHPLEPLVTYAPAVQGFSQSVPLLHYFREGVRKKPLFFMVFCQTRGASQRRRFHSRQHGQQLALISYSPDIHRLISQSGFVGEIGRVEVTSLGRAIAVTTAINMNRCARSAQGMLSS